MNRLYQLVDIGCRGPVRFQAGNDLANSRECVCKLIAWFQRFPVIEALCGAKELDSKSNLKNLLTY